MVRSNCSLYKILRNNNDNDDDDGNDDHDMITQITDNWNREIQVQRCNKLFCILLFEIIMYGTK
jgi:hypothetical protein